jgi:hypothetical protein
MEWVLVAVAAITKCHRLGDLKSRNFLPTVLGAGSPRSRCPEVWCLLSPLSWACRWLLLAVCCYHLCVQIISFDKNISHVGLGPALTTSLEPNHLLKHSIPKYT